MHIARIALIPPSAATRVSAIVVSVMVAVAVTTGVVFGLPAGIAAALGGITVVVMSLMNGPRWHSAAFGSVIGGLAAAATSLASSPIAVAALTATSAVVSLPMVRRYGAVCGTAPVVIAVAGTDAASIGPGAAAVGVTAAAVAVPAALAALGLARIQPAPVSARRAASYVGVLAVGSAVAIGAALYFEIDHALWLVVALSAVLVPARGETTARAGRRVAGTVVGTLVAAVLASFLPWWLALFLAVVLAVVGVGWSVAQDQTRGAAFVAGVLVLVAGAGAADEAWDVAFQRIGLTVVGVLLAVVLALLLAWWERAESGIEESA